jgi:ADP-heptose:LPS heptosyltransferase
VRVLIVRLSALGDVLTGLHALSTLRARDGSAFIGWLVEDRFANLLEGHPQLDRLHVYPRQRKSRIPKFLREVRKERYDLALDLQGNLKSGALARLSGSGRTAGLDRPFSREGNRFLLDELIPPPPGHRVDGYLALIDAVLGPGSHATGFLPAEPSERGAIVLHPGVSRFGAFKRWPADRFAELGDRLARRLAAPVLLTAGPDEREDALEVRGRMREPATLAETPTLRDLVNLLAGARIVVAADTGPAHIAAVVGAPTLTLFGPKDPDVMAPRGPRAGAVSARVRCSPCPFRWCPDPVCMTSLDVDLVESRALALLESR